MRNVIDTFEVCGFLERIDQRMAEVRGKRGNFDAYLALNFVDKGVSIRIGKDGDPIPQLRLDIPADKFDWPRVKETITAWFVQFERRRPPTHEELGRTLGIEPPVTAAIAAE
jgi:hypothetical protein